MSNGTGGDPIVKVDNLSKKFRTYRERNQSLKAALLQGGRGKHDEFWALKDVSFEIERGETFAVLGHNGSGKSTLLKCLTKILQPDGGSVEVNGTLSALLELGAGFHPELSGRENIYLNAAILGVPRKKIAPRFDDIVEFAGLEQFIDNPVKNYSSGMYVRLGFAVAINVEPDVLIVDEVLAVGDAEFQARCSDKIADFHASGRTIVLVTHNMDDAVRICNRAVWLDHGELKMLGTPKDIADAYIERSLSGRTTQYGDHARWGSGELRMEDIRLLDGDGRDLAIARSGEPLTVSIRLESTQPVHDPDIVLSFFDHETRLVSVLSTRSRGHTIDVVDGSRELTFRIDELPLIEGTYDITFEALSGVGGHELDIRNRYVRFEVLKGSNDDRGVITMGGSWDVGATDHVESS